MRTLTLQIITKIVDSHRMRSTKNRWGYAPIAIGLTLVLIGLFILVLSIATDSITYENRYFFWDSLAPVISYSMIIGSFVAVIGVAVLKKISNALSYASISGGFFLIFIGGYMLLTNWIPNNINTLASIIFLRFLL